MTGTRLHRPRTANVLGRHRRPASLTTTLLQALGGAAGGAVCIAVALVVMSLAPGVAGVPQDLRLGAEWRGPGAAEVDLRRTDRLVRRNDCWAGPAPDSVVPSGAVVTLPGRQPQLTGSDVGFAIWLGPDRAPGSGDERRGALHAFCP